MIILIKLLLFQWRKFAQASIGAILKADNFQENDRSYIAADIVAEFCEKTLDACMGGTSNTVLISSVQSGQTTILHTLGLLKETISKFSKVHMKVGLNRSYCKENSIFFYYFRNVAKQSSVS